MDAPSAKIDIKLQVTKCNFILRKTFDAAPNANASRTSAILHVRKKQAMSSAALAM